METNFDLRNRGAEGLCLCCGAITVKQTTLVSGFLAKRAWSGTVEYSDTNRCSSCGFIFQGRGLNKAEAASYYDGYRSYEYFLERNGFEPFYTLRLHRQIDEELHSEERKIALIDYITRNSSYLNEEAKVILDYGGSSGYYLKKFRGHKYVYDLSMVTPEKGVTRMGESDLVKKEFDLILCAQTLEHSSDPKALLFHLYHRLKIGGLLYVEVPYDETWKDYSCPGLVRDYIIGMAKNNRLVYLLMDIYGTAFRVKLKLLPPFAFAPVREHLQYFTPESLSRLGESVGGRVIDASRVKNLGTTLILERRG